MAAPAEDEPLTFRFELRTSSAAPPGSLEHKGADAAAGGIELGEFSRRATITLTTEQMMISPYYVEQLEGAWKGKKGVRLTLPSSAHMEAMQCVLSSIEDMDAVEITDETQFQILSLARRLRLDRLVQRAERFVAMNLNEDTIVAALNLAEQHDLRGLARCCYYWIKRSTDPRFSGSVAEALARDVATTVRGVAEAAAASTSSGSASATPPIFGSGGTRGGGRGGGWGRGGIDAGAGTLASGGEPAFDVDGISGTLQGRGKAEAGTSLLVELSRQEREAKRAFFLPVQLLPALEQPAAKPETKGGAGRSAAGRPSMLGPEAAAAASAEDGSGSIGRSSAGDFLGDEAGGGTGGDAREGDTEVEDVDEDSGAVRMFVGARSGGDPLGASGGAAAGSFRTAKSGAAESSEPAGQAKAADEAAASGSSEAEAAAQDVDEAGGDTDDEEAAAEAKDEDLPEAEPESAEACDEPSAGGKVAPSPMDEALLADLAAEIGFVSPEPESAGVIQPEDVARYRQLVARRASGQLPRYYRVKKPKRAGYEGMVRCYLRRYRDGWGACRHSPEEEDWARVVREVLGETAESEEQELSRRAKRPTGPRSVVAAAKAREGTAMCTRARRHYYELRRERDHSLVMAAACVDESGAFVLTRKADDVRPHGRHYLGAVQGDRLGTRFLIHDFGLAAPSKTGPARRLAEVVPSMAQRTAAEVHFDTNIMGTVPNSCSVVLHPAPANSQAEDLLPKYMNRARLRSVANQAAMANAGLLAQATRFVSSVFEGGAALLFSMDGEPSPVHMPDHPASTSRSICLGVGKASRDAADAHSDALADHVQETTGVRPSFLPKEVARLVSRQPDWNEDMEAWTMDFRARATLASKKNFQLVPEGQRDDEEPRVLFLMGKRGKDLYSVDFAPPLSPAAAFGIALTTFAQKWAVA